MTDHDALFAAMDALGPATDPLAHAQHDDHAGVAKLRAAVVLLDAGKADDAAAAARTAGSTGLPAELVPYRALVEGVAATLAGEPVPAVATLGAAWRDHPDYAALPAALGAARLVAGDPAGAAHAMYAALVSDDPDRSLALHRRRLTLLLGALRTH